MRRVEYEKRQAGNPGMELKCPRSSDLNLDYVVATISIICHLPAPRVPSASTAALHGGDHCIVAHMGNL